MTLILLGLNYQTASLEVREQVYLSEANIAEALVQLRHLGLDEVAVLSTCNRLEIYGVMNDPTEGFERILAFINALPMTPISSLKEQVYWLEGQLVVRHLMRVACGLESRVLGETQILGQVVAALKQSQTAETNGPILSRLFTSAIHTGKRARTETRISQHTLSLSHLAVNYIKSAFNDLSALRILVIGAGEMAELAVEGLIKQGAQSLEIINRTASKADLVAQKFGIYSRSWHELLAVLGHVDVVIAATSAPQPLIQTSNIRTINRKNHLTLIDLGVPRNVDPQINLMPSCTLIDLDHLNEIVETNLQQRYDELKNVETIIEEEIDVFIKWLRIRDIIPLIVQLRGQAEALVQRELEQTFHRLPELKPHEQAILNQMAHRIMNKMLHAPTITLKTLIADGQDFEYTQAIREMVARDELVSA